jgi:beta-1,3-galactosyltransferase 1
MLEWVSSNCPNAKFILKIDDQTFVNVEKLLQIINGKLLDTMSIYGKVSESSDQFNDFDSEFIAGPAYMMTSDCVQPIYKAALDAKYIKFEDIFITGVIANLVGIKRINTEEFKESVSTLNSNCDLRNVVSINGVSADQHYELWFTLNNELNDCN